MNPNPCAEGVEQCLARIRELDGKIRAWEHVDEAGAKLAAQMLDQESASGAPRRPLHGIPFGIKDIIDVAGMPTRAGSPLRAGHVATEDAPVVAALRAAGAVILGKTVTCEFACFDPSPTRNPWNVDHTPGGSSSGSAAAVAAGMCLAAVGTQTGGSVIRPAAYCGVAGYKPTFGTVSREGVVPVSDHLDHVGFFGLSVAFASIAAHCAGATPLGARSSRPGSLTDWWFSGMGPRLCVLGGIFHDRADAEMRRLLKSAIERLAASGCGWIDDEDARQRIEASIGRRMDGAHFEYRDAPAGVEDALHNYRTIMAYDAAQYHRAAFERQPAAFGPNIADLIRTGLSIPAAEYQAALDHQQHYAAAIQPLFEGFDALVMPATPTTAPARLDTTGDPTFNAPWSYVGTPAVTIPCGCDAAGMPAGVQLVGPRGGDGPLLATALWCEKQLGFDERPK